MKKELFMLTISAVKLLSGIGQISYKEVWRKIQLFSKSHQKLSRWVGLCTVMQADLAVNVEKAQNGQIFQLLFPWVSNTLF